MRSIIASVLILALSAFTTAQVRDPASIESFLANGVHVPGSTPLNRFEPLQHRIAYAGKNGQSLVISWNTHIQLQEPSVILDINWHLICVTDYGLFTIQIGVLRIDPWKHQRDGNFQRIDHLSYV